LLAHVDIPLSILALGTANNIAKSLGSAGDIDEIIGRWERARCVPLDLGIAEGIGARRYFVERRGPFEFGEPRGVEAHRHGSRDSPGVKSDLRNGDTIVVHRREPVGDVGDGAIITVWSDLAVVFITRCYGLR
jgi:diacylglycerol kinase (ATP)